MKLKVSIEEIAKRVRKTEKQVQEIIQVAKYAMKPLGKSTNVIEGGRNIFAITTRKGVGIIETEWGQFYEYDFFIEDVWKEYAVIVKVRDLKDDLNPNFKFLDNKLIIRTDSGCKTAQVFHDYTCECREQLHKAMKLIADVGEGMIIHIPRQDGRGMGLPFKLSTLTLQSILRLDTVESANILAPDGCYDRRTCSGIVSILKFFEIATSVKIDMATNNPDKVSILAENGYFLGKMKALVIKATEHTERHLRAKEKHLGHTNLDIVHKDN